MRGAALTLGALAVVWPLWWLGGAAEGWIGLDDLDPLGPVAMVFVGLSAIERFVLTRRNE